jgi:hypothetical protein
LAIPIKRKNDVHLMDAFIDQGWSQKVLLALNKLQMVPLWIQSAGMVNEAFPGSLASNGYIRLILVLHIGLFGKLGFAKFSFLLMSRI